MDWEQVLAIRKARELQHPENTSDSPSPATAGGGFNIPNLNEAEQMVFRMRAELIDYIQAHGLVDGLVFDGTLRQTEDGKIVITAKMIDDVCEKLGYWKEKDVLNLLGVYLPENHYVQDDNYVHTDNNFTDDQVAELAQALVDITEIRKHEKECDKENEERFNEIEGNVSELRDQVDRNLDSINSLTSSTQLIFNSVERLDAIVGIHSEELEGHSREIASLTASSILFSGEIKEIRDWQAEADRVNKKQNEDIDDLKSRNTTNEKNIAALINSDVDINQHLRQIDRDHQTITASYIRLDSDIHKLSDIVQEHYSENEEEHNNLWEAINTEQSERVAGDSELKSEIDKINNELNELPGKFANISSQIITISSQIIGISSQIKTITASSVNLASDIEKINTAIGTINSNISNINSDTERIESKVDSNKSEIDEIRNITNENKTLINSVEQKTNKNEASIESLESRVETNEDSISGLATIAQNQGKDIETIKTDLKETLIIEKNSKTIDLSSALDSSKQRPYLALVNCNARIKTSDGALFGYAPMEITIKAVTPKDSSHSGISGMGITHNCINEENNDRLISANAIIKDQAKPLAYFSIISEKGTSLYVDDLENIETTYYNSGSENYAGLKTFNYTFDTGVMVQSDVTINCGVKFSLKNPDGTYFMQNITGKTIGTIDKGITVPLSTGDKNVKLTGTATVTQVDTSRLYTAVGTIVSDTDLSNKTVTDIDVIIEPETDYYQAYYHGDDFIESMNRLSEGYNFIEANYSYTYLNQEGTLVTQSGHLGHGVAIVHNVRKNSKGSAHYIYAPDKDVYNEYLHIYQDSATNTVGMKLVITSNRIINNLTVTACRFVKAEAIMQRNSIVPKIVTGANIFTSKMPTEILNASARDTFFMLGGYDIKLTSAVLQASVTINNVPLRAIIIKQQNSLSTIPIAAPIQFNITKESAASFNYEEMDIQPTYDPNAEITTFNGTIGLYTEGTDSVVLYCPYDLTNDRHAGILTVELIDIRYVQWIKLN